VEGGFVLRLWLAVVAVAASAGLLAGSALSSPAGTSATPAYPVTITVTNGKVTIPKQPRRIVSLSASATESLFAIGAGSQVVAVDDQSDFPKAAPKTTLSGFTPNVEAIAGYKPDLVIASYDPKGMSDGLQKLGIRVVIQDAPKTLAGAYQQIRQLGLVTGHPSQALTTINGMKKRIATAVTKTKGRANGLSVYHELTPDFYSASSSSFIGRIYAMLGLENIADAADGSSTGYPQLSAEYIVSASPDLIVLADSVCCAQTRATVAARPGFGTVKAVRSGSIVRIDDSVASRWGPRLVNYFQALERAIVRLTS
jgi:iron complex transport system substrate-binding protein